MRGSGFSQYRLEDLRELRQIELGSDPLTICRKDYHFGVVRGNLVPVVVQNNVEAKVRDRKSTRLNSSHGYISYAVFCLKKKNTRTRATRRARPRPDLRERPSLPSIRYISTAFGRPIARLRRPPECGVGPFADSLPILRT